MCINFEKYITSNYSSTLIRNVVLIVVPKKFLAVSIPSKIYRSYDYVLISKIIICFGNLRLKTSNLADMHELELVFMFSRSKLLFHSKLVPSNHVSGTKNKPPDQILSNLQIS